MNVVRSDSRVSLYLQLYDILKEQILSGKYTPDEKIPSAKELSGIHNVSRITVEKAVEALVRENLVHRVQGKGTFVTSSKLRRNLPKLYSFSEDMRELGLVPASRVVEVCVEDAGDRVRTLLRLPERQMQVIKLVRVRLANDEPILLETTCIPAYLCPGLEEYDFERNSLYETLDKHYHLLLEYAEEHYEITSMAPHETELLQCRETSAAFSIKRLAFLENKTPVEYTRAVGRGDRLRFTVKLVRNADTPFKLHIEV